MRSISTKGKSSNAMDQDVACCVGTSDSKAAEDMELLSAARNPEYVKIY